MLTKTFTLAQYTNVWDVADFINDHYNDGRKVTVNGVEAATYGQRGQVATGWGTGSLSVRTRARTTRGYTDAWFKTGRTVTVVVGS